MVELRREQKWESTRLNKSLSTMVLPLGQAEDGLNASVHFMMTALHLPQLTKN